MPSIARTVPLLELGRLSIASHRHLAKKLFSLQVVQQLVEFVGIDAGLELQRVRFHDEGWWIRLAPHIGIIPVSRKLVSP